MNDARSPLTHQTVPLLNPNDLQAQVVEVRVARGDRVAEGDLLCTLHTTKTAFEVHAEASGWVHAMHARVDDVVTAGDRLCSIGTDPPTATTAPETPAEATDAAPLRITKPAERLAAQLGVATERLPRGVLVTESVVRAVAGADAPAAPSSPTDLIVFGGGGHALALLDIIRQVGGFVPRGIVDDAAPDTARLGLPLLGRKDVLARLRAEGIGLAVNAVGAVGNMRIRIDVFDALQAHGFTCPTIVHPRAVIEPSAHIDEGAQVFALAYVGSAVTVGFGAIINTGALLSHDCVIGRCCHIAPGAILAGGVRVGDDTLVGSGVTTDLGVTIGRGVRIGNGARVLADVPDHAIVPAGASWSGAPSRPAGPTGG